MSKVPAHWELFYEIIKMRNRLSPSTLIVANGDITSRSSGIELAKKYNLDGIMIGRGVFQDPYIFSAASPWQSTSQAEKIALYKKQVELFSNTWQNNERRLPTLNKFCKVYIQGFDGAKELREKLMNATDIKSLLDLLN